MSYVRTLRPFRPAKTHEHAGGGAGHSVFSSSAYVALSASLTVVLMLGNILGMRKVAIGMISAARIIPRAAASVSWSISRSMQSAQRLSTLAALRVSGHRRASDARASDVSRDDWVQGHRRVIDASRDDWPQDLGEPPTRPRRASAVAFLHTPAATSRQTAEESECTASERDGSDGAVAFVTSSATRRPSAAGARAAQSAPGESAGAVRATGSLQAAAGDLGREEGSDQ
jgi:hypothetical protein